jgi:hypothetical protein
MRTIRLTAQVDPQHRLTARVPDHIAPGTIEIDIVLPGDTPAERSDEWQRGIAREWADDLSDSRQDIYSLSDGEPVDGAR